jgi:hypothetical protein
MSEFDVVNKPSHYAEGRKFEPIAVIEDWGLNYHLGNALKYISRAGRKDDVLQDLRKAVWYIERYVEEEENNRNCVIEQEQVDFETGCVNLYSEVLKADPRDLEPTAAPVDSRSVWDADEDWMHEGPTNHQEYLKLLEVSSRDGYAHTLEYYDRDRNRTPSEWECSVNTCGWDPTLGPTC